MSKVINVKKAELKKQGFKDLMHWLNSSPNHVYIGRNMTFYVPGAVGSKWANPFKVDKYGREGCLRKYEENIRANPDLMNSLKELENKVLGCWCHPEGCHGDILVKLVNETKK
jgi:hypothetical protein